MRRGEEQYTILVMFGDELRCVCVILAFLLSWMRYECMAVMTSSYICDERSISMGHEVSDEGEPTSW